MRHITRDALRGSDRGVAVLALVSLLAFASPAAAAQDGRSALQSLQDAFVQVAQSVKPAVVNVATTQRPRTQEGRRPPQVPPSFRGPFRDRKSVV